jgi:hypothetical protein
MPVPLPLFHAVQTRVSAICSPFGFRRTTVERLSLLIVGIMAAESCVISAVARKLYGLNVTGASSAESIERRLRRTLSDRGLMRRAYDALLRATIPWEELSEIVLIVDETTKRAQLHYLRVALAYRGSALPLAWSLWPQQQPLPEGTYWREMDRVLARVVALLPADRPVTVVADRAYDSPPFIDRLAARGWHWIVRCKARGTVRFRDHQGTEHALAELVRRHVGSCDRRWKARGMLFKDAGWREVSVVAIWERSAEEPLVVITDLAPRWEVVRTFGCRAWVEPSFRTDKRRGWQWEDCQVRGLAHQHALLLAMAWASVFTVLLGADAAQEAITQVLAAPRSRPPRKPTPARSSLFTHGLHTIQHWIDRRDRRYLPHHLPMPPSMSWSAQWRGLLARRYIFQSVRS